MPWQMAPPLIIICGAFTATGLLLNGFDLLFHGRNRRVRITEYEFQLDRRDERIKAEMKRIQAAEKALLAHPPPVIAASSTGGGGGHH